MKKTLVSIVLMFIAGTSMAQVDTFSLNCMPHNYFLGDDWHCFDSLWYGYTNNQNQPPRHLDGTWCSGPLLYYDGALVRRYPDSMMVGTAGYGHGPVDDYGLHGYLHLNPLIGTSSWEREHIRNFAAGKHSDSPLRVAGVALLLPRYWSGLTVDGPDSVFIPDQLISLGYDYLKLQLMDTMMYVIAEGTTPVADTVGRPTFTFNRFGRDVIEEQIGTSSCYRADYYSYYIFYDMYEVYFDAPVTVTDSFYLAANFESQQYGKENVGISPPCIYESHHYMQRVLHDTSYAHNYVTPKLNWKAQGGYRVVYTTPMDTIHIPVAEDEWFTLEACEENHGYMLIFPILADDCGVQGEASWTSTGGGNVRLSWEPGSWDSQWEVSYGPSGALPGDDSVVTTTSPMAILHGITPGVHYVAYIRSLCTVRDTTWSDWTDSISIFIPAPTEGIASVEERAGVDLQPNPASSTALMTAEVNLTNIEVYTASGAFYRRLPASGLSATLDVASWPSGTYLLLVDTEVGTVTKKLLVQ